MAAQSIKGQLNQRAAQSNKGQLNQTWVNSIKQHVFSL
jgi:hypothetical protein